MPCRWILVVDGEPTMARMLLDGLQEAGWEASAVTGAADALALLTRRRFAAVVSDVRMVGDDGFSLLHSIRERGEALPVILMSSFGRNEAARRARAAGAFAYLDKPFGLDQLLDLLERLPSCLEEPT